jgi:hypothetical protein
VTSVTRAAWAMAIGAFHFLFGESRFITNSTLQAVNMGCNLQREYSLFMFIMLEEISLNRN